MRQVNESTIQIDDHTHLFCKISGSGPPALLLHGVPDSADLWDAITPKLGGRFHCYAPDLPGFGRSDPLPGQTFDLSGHVATIDQLIETLAIPTPLTLVAHDWGAIMAMAWAARHPDKVRQLVVASAPFHDSYRWHAWARVWQTPLAGGVAMRLLGSALGESILVKELRRGSRKLPIERMKATYAMAKRPATRRTILKVYRGVSADQFGAWNPRLRDGSGRYPFSVLWGEHDPYLPLEQADKLGADEVTLVPGVGHWVPSEAPATVARAVLRDAPARR